MGRKVLVPIADGTEEIEATCIVDTLRRAGAEVMVASVGQPQVKASRGVRLVADARISDYMNESFDAIVLPGGLPGAEHLRDSTDLIRKLREQKQAGRLIAAVCAAPATVLQTHGLLNGVKATCYPTMLDQLDPALAVNERVVVDGAFITGQGPAVAIEFALRVVEALFGAEKAKEVGDAMLFTA
jgi:4-methyl-5(b-hydroxyethyl)-thiazole monophosphate biosynthesis